MDAHESLLTNWLRAAEKCKKNPIYGYEPPGWLSGEVSAQVMLETRGPIFWGQKISHVAEQRAPKALHPGATTTEAHT